MSLSSLRCAAITKNPHSQWLATVAAYIFTYSVFYDWSAMALSHIIVIQDLG